MNPTQPAQRIVSPDAQRLVIARLGQIPDDVMISVGSHGEFSKGEIIQHIRAGDAVGVAMVDSQLRFLRALGEGTLLNDLVSDSF